ncbi:MAG: hypothetical protein WC942_00190 [Clostridia bacterium]|jgi:hypothetical protein
MAIENKLMCYAIIIKGNQVLLCECKKGSRLYYSFLGVEYSKGLEEDCVKNYLLNNIGIEAVPVKKVYEYIGHDYTANFFLLNWTSGIAKKTGDNIHITPVLVNLNKLIDTTLLPAEIKQQIILDYAKFGKNLANNLITVYEE